MTNYKPMICPKCGTEGFLKKNDKWECTRCAFNVGVEKEKKNESKD